MCLAIPGKVVALNDEDKSAIVDYEGLRQTASVLLCPDAAIGDLVLVHAGFIIRILPASYGSELQTLAKEAELL